jgi:CRISPR-associated protein (TIGR03986 family)
MARFYNPYHFVPVERAPAAAKREDFRKELAGGGEGKKFPRQVTHERYVRDTHSGRLVVRLTTVTPTVIGGRQEPEKGPEHPRVQPYTIDGCAAIPASTLRGLIGNVVEAASGGPLRILDDSAYSYRKKMEQSLSAIGLLVNSMGGLALRPMCLPTLSSRNGGATFEAPPRFQRLFPKKPQFKVYFGDGRQIRDRAFPYRSGRSKTDAVPMPVKQLAWHGNAVADDASLHTKASRWAVSQTAREGEAPRMGMIRVLGCWGDDRADIPFNKTHELWIPLPDMESKPLEIPTETLDRFHQLADERTAQDPSLPFEPKETRPGRAGDLFRLRPGDMVYFDVDERGNVIEIALSSIWRGRVEDKGTHQAASTWKFFDGELLPFNPERTTVSMAEQILGFAEEFPRGEEKPANADGGLALASRVRFDNALPRAGEKPALGNPVVLRILDTPKLPCPALYFKGRGGAAGTYIPKPELNPVNHQPQGRKWYLHARQEAGKALWATATAEDRPKQKSIVEPIRAGEEFFFPIDFDNLTDSELGLVLYALEPDEKFHHKVGMGKPLGLGTVKLEVLGYCRVDRQSRYSLAGLRAGRYSEAEFTPAGKKVRDAGNWPSRYGAELEAMMAGVPECGALTRVREVLRNARAVAPAVDHAICLLGDYAGSPEADRVHYPTVVRQNDKEAEHYEWFVFNDGQRENRQEMSPSRQALRPIGKEKALPELTELEF